MPKALNKHGLYVQKLLVFMGFVWMHASLAREDCCGGCLHVVDIWKHMKSSRWVLEDYRLVLEGLANFHGHVFEHGPPEFYLPQESMAPSLIPSCHNKDFSPSYLFSNGSTTILWSPASFVFFNQEGTFPVLHGLFILIRYRHIIPKPWG